MNRGNKDPRWDRAAQEALAEIRQMQNQKEQKGSSEEDLLNDDQGKELPGSPPANFLPD